MSSWSQYAKQAHSYRPFGKGGQCLHTGEALARIITVRGHTQVAWWCFDCSDYSRRAPGRAATFLRISDHPDKATYPIARDYTKHRALVAAHKARCSRCQSLTFLDTHHWAPKHLFPDADSWPTAKLCRECHMEWHRVVTPNMHKRGRQLDDD